LKVTFTSVESLRSGMPTHTIKALRVLAAHLVQEAEVLQRMAREALADADRLEKKSRSVPKTRKPDNGPSNRSKSVDETGSMRILVP
jgi:hypothetical protein